jgi:hypothetical protein
MKILYTRLLNFLLHKDNLFRIVALFPFVTVMFVATWFLVSLPSALLSLGYAICGVIAVDLISLWVNNAYDLARTYREKLTRVLQSTQVETLQKTTEEPKKEKTVSEVPKPVKLKERRKSTIPPAPAKIQVVGDPISITKKLPGRGRPKTTPKES